MKHYLKHLATLLCLISMAVGVSAQAESASTGMSGTQPTTRGTLKSAPYYTVGEPVDMGFPSGIKWSSINIGAKNEYDPGLYFAWGQTAGYAKNSNHQFTQAENPRSVVNALATPLSPSQDAATVNWGGYWRMPTASDMSELYTFTTWKVIDSLQCFVLTSTKNGNQIYIPLSGCISNGVLREAQRAQVWASESSTESLDKAGYSFGSNSSFSINSWGEYIYVGMPIRPVYDDQPVDMGMSVRWAPMNVGATSVEEMGLFFGWGETTGYSSIDPDVYSGTSIYTGADGLPLDADAAAAHLGLCYRIPTKAECEQLLNNSTRTDAMINGVKGVEVRSNSTKKTLFFPYSGFVNADRDAFYDYGQWANIWTSSRYDVSLYYGYGLKMASSSKSSDVSGKPGYARMPVRAVSNLMINFPKQLTVPQGGSVSVAVSTKPEIDMNTITFRMTGSNFDTGYSGGTFTLYAHPNASGTETLTISANGSSVQCSVKVLEVTPEEQQCMPVVDLGLSVKWGAKNLGAKDAIDVGDYFAFGEVLPKDNYSSSTYTGSDILPRDNDAAYRYWGAKFRMPTEAEMRELLSKCSLLLCTKDGQYYYIVTSNVNGNVMLLPAGGYKNGMGVLEPSSLCYSTNNKNVVLHGFSVTAPDAAAIGRLIRPVYDEVFDPETMIEFDPGTMIDFHLPSGTIWAKKDLGATSEQDWGLHYSLAQASCGHADDPAVKSVGIPYEYDVAHRELGEGWHIPTREQWDELHANVGYSGIETHNTNGRWCQFFRRSSGGDIILLPAIGSYFADGDYRSGYYLHWSSTAASSMSYNFADVDYLAIRIMDVGGAFRASIRPVFDPSLILSIPQNMYFVNGSIRQSLYMQIGTNKQLQVKLLPEKYTQMDVEWFSSNASIVSVSNTGYLVAHQAGTATITGRCKKAYGICVTCQVEVGTESRQDHYDFDLNKHSLVLQIGNSKTLEPTISSGATMPELFWTSSDPTKVKVDQTGKITALQAGEATITVVTMDGYNMSAQCRVQVPKQAELVHSITLSDMRVPVNGNVQMTALVMPATADNREVRWSSGNESIVRIDSVTGLAYGVAVGTATITAQATDGSRVMGRCQVRVLNEYIDLGLATRWGSKNVGANSPYEKGDEINHSTPDPAGVAWGTPWRLPSQAEWDQLASECDWVWSSFKTMINGTLTPVSGFWVIGKRQGYTDNAIFLPSDKADKEVAISMYRRTDGNNGMYVRPVVTERPTPVQKVDMGLSVLWADANVGAFDQTDCGDYYAWGDRTIRPLYDWTSYTYATASPDGHVRLIKYVTTDTYCTAGSSLDQRWTLELNDDVANSKMQSDWRMPTDAEIAELRNPNNCEWTWFGEGNAEYHGIAGYRVTSLITGASIFLPAAGRKTVDGLIGYGQTGNYWSNTLNRSTPILAWHLCFDFSGSCQGFSNRCDGLVVRAVCAYK